MAYIQLIAVHKRWFCTARGKQVGLASSLEEGHNLFADATDGCFVSIITYFVTAGDVNAFPIFIHS